MDELTVTIPLERYECLLDLETRMTVLTERVIHGRVNAEDVLRIIGSNIAIREADKLHEKDEQEAEKRLERYGIEDAEM